MDAARSTTPRSITAPEPGPERRPMSRGGISASSKPSSGIGQSSLCLDVSERAAIACERRGLSGERLPAQHGDIDVYWGYFDCVTRAAGHLGCDDRGAGAREWFRHDIA